MSVPTSIIALPSGFFEVTEHLCVLVLCATKNSAAKAGLTMPATSRPAIRYFCIGVLLEVSVALGRSRRPGHHGTKLSSLGRRWAPRLRTVSRRHCASTRLECVSASVVALQYCHPKPLLLL